MWQSPYVRQAVLRASPNTGNKSNNVVVAPTTDWGWLGGCGSKGKRPLSRGRVAPYVMQALVMPGNVVVAACKYFT